MGVTTRKFFFSMLLIGCFLQAKPQRTVDIGILAGAATYWGDIERNFGQVNYGEQITSQYGLIGRYSFNPRIAVRGQLLTGKLAATGIFQGANLAEFVEGVTQYVKKGDDSYNFKRSVHTLEAIFEFNFMDYQMGILKKNRFSPFLSLGLGCIYSKPQPVKNPPGGTIVLMPTFSSPSPIPGRNLYDPIPNTMVLAPTIPVGFGIKYNLTKKLGACVEMSIRKTFTDDIDNLNDPARYQNSIPGIIQPGITQTYPDQFVPGAMYNNDWFASVNISLHWQIWTDKGVCKVLEDKNSYYGKKSGF